MIKDMIRASFTESRRTLDEFLAADANIDTLEKLAVLLAESFSRGGKVIVFGNGGSMCDAMHFAEELTGRFHRDRKALPAIAISDPSHITCVGNDYGFGKIFSRGVEAYARSGDVVLGISTSGNSTNVIEGLRAAREIGCVTAALLGGDGGKIAGTCDYEFIVPAKTSDRVQEIHTMILHILTGCVESLLFPEQHTGQ
jgi:D-sedoheptulose 7-phosphate isomerase